MGIETTKRRATKQLFRHCPTSVARGIETTVQHIRIWRAGIWDGKRELRSGELDLAPTRQSLWE